MECDKEKKESNRSNIFDYLINVILDDAVGLQSG